LRNLASLAAASAKKAIPGVLLLITGCGGGGGNDTPSAPEANVQSVVIGPGPANNVNLLFTTVTICAPGSATNCQSIDHVLVDTGSTGLRILSSVLSPSLALPQQTDAASNPIVACGQFVDGYTWGPVKIADVRMAQELASSVPIQVVADPAFSAVPTDCSGTAPASNTAQVFGANGLIGLNVFQQDCGDACANTAVPGAYYACPSSGCQPAQVGLAQQLQNPVGMFSTDNNGIIIALPPISQNGAASVSGLLVFGIGTRGNNGLGNAQVIPLDPNRATFTTRLNGSITYPDSFIDSGSNGLYFSFPGLPACGSDPVFHCPASTQSFSASNQGISGPPSFVNFQVANADALFSSHPSFFAFNNLAGEGANSTSFDWGLPFFYGRTVYTAIEGRSTPAGTGPYVAY
jgi:hypothetical protein